MAVDGINYPGNTFLDMDCESSGYYEGKLPGTVSISGYSEEYREHQLLLSPLLNLSLESSSVLQVPPPLNQIVQRIQTLQRMPTSEDNEALRSMLGLSQYVNQSKISYTQKLNRNAGWQPCSTGSIPSATDRDKSRSFV